ncbi:MAG TPA: thioesterase family protein [Acidobacteriota bacterium]|nr:thioesterase family protein [Acidobacteriota bacterium]
MDYSQSELRVRYAETDQMGVAYHANYLVWFEVGRTDYCRHKGFTYERMERETDTFMVVVEAYCRYRRPLRYDQVFVVRTRVERLRRRAMTFAYQILDAESQEELARGYTKHVVTDGRGRPKSLPVEFREYFA